MEGLRVLANPEELALFYYKNGADEILLMLWPAFTEGTLC